MRNCNTKMQRILVLMLLFAIGMVTETYCDEEPALTFKYGGMDQHEAMPDYFEIAMDEVKLKEGSDTIFIVNGNVEQKLDFDDEWKVQITAFRSDTENGEYAEFMTFPPIGTCQFMKTVYKNFFYSVMKECSNLPAPDTCPIPKEKYTTKCEFDADVFRKFSRPGFYKIKTDLYKNDELKTGIVVRGSVHEK